MLIGVWNYYESLHKNNFMLSAFTGSSLGEDSMKSFYDFYLKSRKKGYQVKILNNIKDINKVDLLIFINYPNIKNNIPKYALTTSKPKFLLNYECPTIYPETWRKKNFKFFDKIFTWDDTLIDNKKFFKTNSPSYYSPRLERFDLKRKNKFCVIICSNKSNDHKYDLYNKRLEIINWFEKKHPDKLEFYGYGWSYFFFKGPKFIRILNRLKILTKLFSKKYITYKGEYYGPKRELLKNYKFSICFENARFYKGYLTEKIFHCFFSLTVPIYLGSPNITDHIPKKCFIDMRDFKSYEDLYKYLDSMSKSEYINYILSIKEFLKSKKFDQFSIKYFTNLLMKHVDSVGNKPIKNVK